jgi:GR25 family glycosyltransferase involved in LPS biosynthesis
MKTYTIVMPESEHSVRLAEDCIEAGQSFGINVEKWPAVLGTNAKEKFKEYGIKNLLHKKIEALEGVQGCFLSHYELWQHCVQLKETICILEHDGVFIRPLPDNVESHFSDVLNLDPYPQSDKDYDQRVKDSVTLPIDYFYAPAGKSSAAGEYVAGAYGYLITPQGAKKLIEFTLRVGALPTDKHIGRNIVDLKSTTVPVVRLHEFYSTHSIPKFSSTKNLRAFIKETDDAV